MTPTDEVNKRFPRGTKVIGIVRYISYFGYFIEIPGVEILGLVETTFFDESEKKNIPEIGSEIEAVIIQFRDSRRSLSRQFRLSVHPTDLANPERLKKPLEG